MPAPVINIAQMREWERATWATGQTEAEVIRRVGLAVASRALELTRPGDTILMYGIGFGTVTPDSPAGEIVTQSNQLTQPLQILFGQTPAQISYAGLSPGFVGLYQFNLVVPPVPDNDLTPLTFNLGGVAGTQTLYIAVKQAPSQ